MTRSRSRVAALLVAVVGLLAVVAPPAQAYVFTVPVGQNQLLPCDFTCPAALVTISPANAGTVSDGIVFAPSLVFTPSLSFRGLATITTSNGEVFTVDVVAPTNASASGTFTPVGRPGPCLLLTAGAAVSFGDVQVGGPVVEGSPGVAFRGCAPAEVEVDITVSATDAASQGGGDPITNVGSTCTDSIFFPSPGCALTGSSFVVQIGEARADSEQAVQLNFGDPLPGNFLAASFGVFLQLAGGIPQSQQGSPFSFGITFTAVEA